MLSYEEKTAVEESVLGTIIFYPETESYAIDKLRRDLFSSQERQDMFSFLKAEKDAKRIMNLQAIKDIDLQTEILRLGTKTHLINFKSYVNILIVEGHINDLYNLGTTLQNQAMEDNPSLIKMLDSITNITSGILNIEDEFTISMKTALQSIEENIIKYKEYIIGWKTIDELCPVSSQSITIVGGNQGTFKTKMMIYVMRALLFRYSNISVLWYSMEDPADKIVRGFVSQTTGLTDKELKQIDYSSLIPEDVKKFDIEFVTKSSTIFDIGTRFKKFSDSRENNFCILIIDNLMKIIPVGKNTDPDLEIVREIESWNIKTSKKERAVYLLHHFTKAVHDEKNKSSGYTPNISHLRGSGRWADSVTNALLVNALYSYPDIVKTFKGYESFMEHYYVVTIAKNRNGEKGVSRMLAFPASNEFVEL